MRLLLFAVSLLLVLLVVGYFFFCIVIMSRNVSPGRPRFAVLLPLALFDGSLFNETGNRYRKRALGINVVLLISIVVLVISGN